MAPPSDLVAAIKGATSDTQLQEALLFGSYGESGWTNANLFGFTTFGTGDIGASDATQVNAIIGNYQEAESQLPAGLSGAAAAEWIALGAEGPAFSRPSIIQAYGISPAPTSSDPNREYEYASGSWYWNNPQVQGVSQQEAIAETGQTTQYGANTSLNQTTSAGVWSDIVSALSVSANDPTNQPSVGGGGGEQTGPPNKSGTSGQRETPAGAAAYAKSMASLEPQQADNPDPQNPKGFVYRLNQYMNPQFKQEGNDQDGNKRSFWGSLEDAAISTTLPGLQLLGIGASEVGKVTGANTIIHDAEVVSNPQNIMRIIRQWITRLAVFAVGAVVVFIAVNALTHGALLNLVTGAAKTAAIA